MPVSTFYSLQWEGRNMLAEILNLPRASASCSRLREVEKIKQRNETIFEELSREKRAEKEAKV
jgi:hypothetical protein